MKTKLIVGLGNPGKAYEKTRHNAGFWLLDEMIGASAFSLDKKIGALLAESIIAGQKIIWAKPQTYMNLSGDAVQKILHFHKWQADEMLVVHDELDFAPGVCRLKEGGGHGGHNGLRDIIQKTGQKNFLRLRLGIGHPGRADQVAHYVLQKPAKAEEAALLNSFKQAENAIHLLLNKDLATAMQTLHSQA